MTSYEHSTYNVCSQGSLRKTSKSQQLRDRNYALLLFIVKYKYKRMISIKLNTFHTIFEVIKNTAVFLFPWT